jgi:hypothetical protein
MNIFCNIAERRILESYDRGEFENLQYGKPIDNTDYFSVPPEDRIAFHLLKNAGIVPHEVEIRKELYNLKNCINETNEIDNREQLMKKYALLENQMLLSNSRKY